MFGLDILELCEDGYEAWVNYCDSTKQDTEQGEYDLDDSIPF